MIDGSLPVRSMLSNGCDDNTLSLSQVRGGDGGSGGGGAAGGHKAGGGGGGQGTRPPRARHRLHTAAFGAAGVLCRRKRAAGLPEPRTLETHTYFFLAGTNCTQLQCERFNAACGLAVCITLGANGASGGTVFIRVGKGTAITSADM